MDELRLILSLFGALLVVGVYLHSRHRARDMTQDANLRAREPRLGDRDGDDELPDDLPALHAAHVADVAMDEVASDVAGDAVPADRTSGAHAGEKIIALNILPREPDARFPGADLLDVFDRAGLEYGQYDVFHRVLDTAEGPVSVFSVASATEPGSFDITSMAEQDFRGLSLFMLLPGPQRGVDAFADMLATARRIAEQLHGEVKDRGRGTMSRQTAYHIREEIVAFENRLKLDT